MSAEKDFNIVTSMAEWLGLEGEGRDNFVNASMKSKGHKPVMSWADNEENSGKKSEGNPFDKLFEKDNGGESGGTHREKSSGGWMSQYDN